MTRVTENGQWTFFDPADVGDRLLKTDDFEREYIELEQSPQYWRKSMPAQVVFNNLCHVQIMTGGPAVLFQDTIYGVYFLR